jgi:hypothetical protein
MVCVFTVHGHSLLDQIKVGEQVKRPVSNAVLGTSGMIIWANEMLSGDVNEILGGESGS